MAPTPAYRIENAGPGITHLIQVYGAFRDYAKHEDELINRRLSWNLTLQGFLFAAYGLRSQVAAAGSKESPRFKALSYVFPFVGAFVAYLVYKSIRAAQLAIDGVRCKWIDGVSHSLRELLPGHTGGGNLKAVKWGERPQKGIPLVIIAAWVAIICISIVWR
jgi:hypothetical protein